MEKIFDAKGMACPLPVIHAKNESEKLKENDVLKILVDNEIAVQNLTRFATHKNYDVTSLKESDTSFIVTMKITKTENDVEETIVCNVDNRDKGMVVVIDGNTMGKGEEKLGKILMKAFIFALTKQDVLPEIILCYNAGAYLTCEGSDSIEDLKTLEANGVEIFTCGTCLDFYNLKEKLVVGNVSNMYDIVETMEKATKIIKP